MTDQELAQVVETTTVFAKLSPDQKARIILCLKNNVQGGLHGRWDQRCSIHEGLRRWDLRGYRCGYRQGNGRCHPSG